MSRQDKSMMSAGKLIAAASIALALAALPTYALDPRARITQYRHTAWRVQEGAFDSVPNAITQTQDGYIWIGTGSGLVKYDGVRFAPWIPPASESASISTIFSLQGSSDGTLWIGTNVRLLSWKNNHLQEHVRGRINSILEDRKARIWVARSRIAGGGVCQAAGDQPRCMGSDERMQLRYAGPLAEDMDGNLWIGASDRLMRWRDGTFETYFKDQLAKYKDLSSIDAIATAADGSAWVSIPVEGAGLYRFEKGAGRKIVLRGTDTTHIISLFIDRNGAVWMGTSNDGVYRLHGDRVDRFRGEDGLSSNTVNGFFEDREGNLWLTTSKGLDCFRDNRVLTFSTSEGLGADLVSSVLASDDGTVWIGNRGALERLEGDTVTAIPIPGRRVTGLWQDHAKRLWVGVDNQLTVYDHGQFQKIERADGGALGITRAITEDRDQNVWAATVGDRTLFRIRNLRVQDEFASDQIPPAWVVAPDRAGGIWLGLAGRGLGHYRTGKLDAVPVEPDDRQGLAFTVDADGSAWVATRGGIAYWKNGQMKTLTSRNGLPCGKVYAAIRDNQATLWLYTECGLLGILNSEIERWWEDPSRRILFQILDVLDGAMPGASTFQPAVSKSPDGRLWFVNDKSLQMFDPAGLKQNPIPPPVYIEELHADRKDYPAGGFIHLPAHSRDLEIGYTALSFSNPQKVCFRYKLDGRDQEWQDAGTRRRAYYTDLAPRQYRFRVRASNNSGVWNETGDSLEFSIAPAYYQTNWFRLSLVHLSGIARRALSTAAAVPGASIQRASRRTRGRTHSNRAGVARYPAAEFSRRVAAVSRGDVPAPRSLGSPEEAGGDHGAGPCGDHRGPRCGARIALLHRGYQRPCPVDHNRRRWACRRTLFYSSWPELSRVSCAGGGQIEGPPSDHPRRSLSDCLRGAAQCLPPRTRQTYRGGNPL